MKRFIVVLCISVTALLMAVGCDDLAANKKTDLDALNEAIAAAEAAVDIDNIFIDTDPANVPQGDKFVTQEDYNTYVGAIAAAKKVVEDKGDIAAALAALNKATSDFIAAQKTGTNTTIDSGNIYKRTEPSLSGPDFRAAPYSGKLVSRGVATASGAKTYYIDYERGNDTNNGESPEAAWQTLGMANAKTFNPGDHILLEAHSVWNGTPVDISNYEDTTFLNNPGGQLWPKGNGMQGNPIVIDLYNNDNGTISYQATQRPIINGNGTPSGDTNPYAASGAIHLQGQDYWEIRNIEVTNSFQDFSISTIRDTHWYQRAVRKALLGIYVHSTSTHSHNKGILIEHCYAHDVQSEHNNNSNGTGAVENKYFGTTSSPGKTGGGIIVEITDSTVQYNIVRRVGLEGLRTNHGNWGNNILFKGNYIETVAGDGMVMSRVQDGCVVESNIIKDACAAPNLGGGNYASNWCYVGNNILYQYNEGYGTLYGYLDGEAWDIDNESKNVVYQYNYSHHNSGGTVLFMSDGCTNGVFRYNISANDGGGSRYMATIDTNGQKVDPTAASYTAWDKGQSLIHYTIGGTTGSSNIPIVYNNTFYIGDGITTAVYGNTSSGSGIKYVRFFNNILLKAGEGAVQLSNTHNPSATTYNESYIRNDAGFKNNLLWAYDDTEGPTVGIKTKFSNGKGSSITKLQTTQGNVWKNPRLKIQIQGNISGNELSLRAQRDDAFPEAAYNDPEALKEFASIDRLRRRASLFTPIDATSPVIKQGLVVDAANMDGTAYFGPQKDLSQDFFGQTIDPAKPPIGASVGVWAP